MKKVLPIIIILILLAVSASADRLSQILFPMDFIEAGITDYVLFYVNNNDAFTINAVRVRNDSFISRYRSIPSNDESDLKYKIRGSESGKLLSKDDLSKEEMIEYFVDFCGDDIIAAFDAFDYSLPLLLEEADFYGILINNRCLDVTWLARIYFQSLKSHSIESLCNATEFPYEEDYYPEVMCKCIKEARKVYRLSKLY